MAFLTEDQVRKRAKITTDFLTKSARDILAGARADADTGFDIFLSHSSNEPDEILLGIKRLLEDEELTVYVDRYTDPHLSYSSINAKTAETLERRMRHSSSLLYVYSSHSTTSRWMPWELGFFDGLKGRVGVVPVVQSKKDEFKGEEYIGLYPYVDQAVSTIKETQRLWINRAPNEYALLKLWAFGNDIRKRQS